MVGGDRKQIFFNLPNATLVSMWLQKINVKADPEKRCALICRSRQMRYCTMKLSLRFRTSHNFDKSGV